MRQDQLEAIEVRLSSSPHGPAREAMTMLVAEVKRLRTAELARAGDRDEFIAARREFEAAMRVTRAEVFERLKANVANRLRQKAEEIRGMPSSGVTPRDMAALVAEWAASIEQERDVLGDSLPL